MGPGTLERNSANRMMRNIEKNEKKIQGFSLSHQNISGEGAMGNTSTLCAIVGKDFARSGEGEGQGGKGGQERRREEASQDKRRCNEKFKIDSKILPSVWTEGEYAG